MRLASMVLPEPGGPIIRMLWPPAEATSSARLAVCWPRTSLKSMPVWRCCVSNSAVLTWIGATPLPVLSRLTTSSSERTGYTESPLTTAASRALASGTTRFLILRARASMATGSAPRTARTPPSSESSPRKRKSDRSDLVSPP